LASYEGPLLRSLKNDLRGIALALAVTMLTFASVHAAGGRSCYGASCRDKIVETMQCFATLADEFMLLRSLPSQQSQAVGMIAKGEKVYVADRKPGWMFVQATDSQNGGWISSGLLTKCGPSSPSGDDR
jgi:uncharacterized protein YgiM (DUF1202 family)